MATWDSLLLPPLFARRPPLGGRMSFVRNPLGRFTDLVSRMPTTQTPQQLAAYLVGLPLPFMEPTEARTDNASVLRAITVPNAPSPEGQSPIPGTIQATDQQLPSPSPADVPRPEPAPTTPAATVQQLPEPPLGTQRRPFQRPQPLGTQSWRMVEQLISSEIDSVDSPDEKASVEPRISDVLNHPLQLKSIDRADFLAYQSLQPSTPSQTTPAPEDLRPPQGQVNDLQASDTSPPHPASPKSSIADRQGFEPSQVETAMGDMRLGPAERFTELSGHQLPHPPESPNTVGESPSGAAAGISDFPSEQTTLAPPPQGTPLQRQSIDPPPPSMTPPNPDAAEFLLEDTTNSTDSNLQSLPELEAETMEDAQDAKTFRFSSPPLAPETYGKEAPQLLTSAQAPPASISQNLEAPPEPLPSTADGDPTFLQRQALPFPNIETSAATAPVPVEGSLPVPIDEPMADPHAAIEAHLPDQTGSKEQDIDTSPAPAAPGLNGSDEAVRLQDAEGETNNLDRNSTYPPSPRPVSPSGGSPLLPSLQAKLNAPAISQAFLTPRLPLAEPDHYRLPQVQPAVEQPPIQTSPNQEQSDPSLRDDRPQPPAEVGQAVSGVSRVGELLLDGATSPQSFTTPWTTQFNLEADSSPLEPEVSEMNAKPIQALRTESGLTTAETSAAAESPTASPTEALTEADPTAESATATVTAQDEEASPDEENLGCLAEYIYQELRSRWCLTLEAHHGLHRSPPAWFTLTGFSAQVPGLFRPNPAIPSPPKLQQLTTLVRQQVESRLRQDQERCPSPYSLR